MGEPIRLSLRRLERKEQLTGCSRIDGHPLTGRHPKRVGTSPLRCCEHKHLLSIKHRKLDAMPGGDGHLVEKGLCYRGEIEQGRAGPHVGGESRRR